MYSGLDCSESEAAWEDIITQTSSTQTNDYESEEVSDVEHEDNSQEIPFCDSSPLNATHSKNKWPILNKL